MPYPQPSAGFFYQPGNGIAAALYRLAIDVIQEYGATGDGVTDDWRAITTALGVAQSSGVPLFFPSINPAGNPAVYGVSQEIPINAGVRILGDAVSSSKGPVIRALSSMRSVMALRTTDAGFTSSAAMKPAYLEGITLDANGKADQALLVQGVFFGSFRYCNFYGGVRHAARLPHHGVAPTIGTVTSNRPGGSPAATSVAITDPNYTGFTSATTVVIKCASNGGLNAATYVASFDGGVSFATAAQTIAAVSNVCVTSSTTYLYDSGVRVTFGPGSYVTGDILAQFTVTLNDESSPGNHNAINADCVFDHCEFRNSGQIQGSVGAIGTYGGYAPTIVTAAGTVSTTFLSQVVTGTGTAFLTGTSVPSRNGDFIWISTLGNLPIACVLDDAHVALAQGITPTTTSGKDWALSAGAGYWEDDNAENTRVALDYCRASTVPVCVRQTGTNGGGLVGHRMRQELYGFAGTVVGGTLFALPRFLWSYLHIEAGSANANTVFLMPRCNGGTFVEPCELFPTGATVGPLFDYGAGSAMVIKGGQITYFGGLGSIIAGTTATSANAGAASALPATPQEYITILNAAGQARKVPLYLP